VHHTKKYIFSTSSHHEYGFLGESEGLPPTQRATECSSLRFFQTAPPFGKFRFFYAIVTKNSNMNSPSGTALAPEAAKLSNLLPY
jgi:hypothetical protein